MTKLIINLKTLKAINTFASTDQYRYSINGVYVDNGKLIATHGHKLAIVKPLDGDFPPCKSFILPSSAIKSLSIKTKKYEKIFAIINTNTKTIKPHIVDDNNTQTTFSYQPIDGKYPDYIRVIPAQPHHTTPKSICFNPEILGACSVFGNSAQFIFGECEKTPVKFKAKTDDFEVFGVLMPLPMLSGIDDSIPEWAGIK